MKRSFFYIFSLFDPYDIQSTISDGGDRSYFKTDCIVNAGTLQKQSVATMLPSSNHLHVDLVQRKSASMCFPVPPTLEELGVSWVKTDNLALPAAFFVVNKEPENFLSLKSTTALQQRGSICLPLLRRDEVSIQAVTYRDNMLPQLREPVRLSSNLNLSNRRNKHYESMATDLPIVIKSSCSSQESTKSSKSSFSSDKDALINKNQNCNERETSFLIHEDDDFL